MGIYSHDVRMYICVRHAWECRGDVTLECRGVMFPGLGIRNVTCVYVYAYRMALN